MDRSVNAGVSAQTGFALQRNTALYILLENYRERFQGNNYFICIEHADDFLFCFLNDEENATKIDAYQSKKKSTGDWTINKTFDGVLETLLKTGDKLDGDLISKSQGYNHRLYFISNKTITLGFKVEDKDKEVSIKEDRCEVAYENLPAELKTKIKDRIDSSLHAELSNLNFCWVDLNRTASKQRNELIGQIINLFEKDIPDPAAAVDTIFTLFHHVELIYNQNNETQLLDETKRVSSERIEGTFDLLTTKAKAFKEWRNQIDNISTQLNIKHFERDSFELKFNSAFELFKDITELEHRKILVFVKGNYMNCKGPSLSQIVVELCDLFSTTFESKFESDDLTAIVYAAYFEATKRMK